MLICFIHKSDICPIVVQVKNLMVIYLMGVRTFAIKMFLKIKLCSNMFLPTLSHACWYCKSNKIEFYIKKS